MIRPAASTIAFKTISGLLLCAALSTVAATAADELEVTYVGNSGFLVAVGETRVLVDGLYRDGVTGYVTIPAEALEKLERGTAPFDGIDLILATHAHADHFDPQSVALCLAANPKALFVSTPQAVEKLRSAVTNFDALKPRVRSELPAAGEARSFDHAGVSVRVFNLGHGDSPMENLGFVVALAGRTFTHFGDTEATTEELAPYRLHLEPIDLAFVGYWDLQVGARRRMYHDNVGAQSIVAMHLPLPDAPASYFGKAGSLERAVEQIRLAMPDVIVFDRALESRRIDPPVKDGS